jgi:hypothetical protein
VSVCEWIIYIRKTGNGNMKWIGKQETEIWKKECHT